MSSDSSISWAPSSIPWQNSMDSTIPGSQNDAFFELLHPNASLTPPHAVIPASEPSQNGSVAADPPRTESFELGGEEIEPSFDFQPIRSNSFPKVVDAGTRPDVISSSGSKGRPSSASDNNYEPKTFPSSEPARTWDPASKSKEEREFYDSVTVSAVERTMKKYADNLMHVLEGMSERLSKLETTAQGLEHVIEGLKIAEGENHGQTSGRIVRLEQLIKEVHTGVQLLYNRQEEVEAKSQLMMPQLANDKATLSGGMTHTPTVDGWQQTKGEGIGHHLVSSLPPQQPSRHPQAPPASQQLSHHSQASPPLPLVLPAPQQLLSPQISVNMPNEPGTPTIQQPLPPPQQQHLAPPPHPAQPPPHSMQLSSFYSQPPQQHQGSFNQQVEPTPYGVQPHIHHPVPTTPPSSSYIPELPQYTPANYEGPRTLTAPQQSLPSHQQHGPGGHQQIFEPVIGRMGSTPNNLPPPYVQQPQSSPPISMYETPTGGYGAPPYRVVAQPVPSAPSGGSGYPRLPTAQPLQHALPATSGSPSGAPQSTNRVPIDEVIEKVAAMGFSREQVKAVVRRLSENGQSVDLNVVLDKLMNGGGEFQAPKGWFSR